MLNNLAAFVDNWKDLWQPLLKCKRISSFLALATIEDAFCDLFIQDRLVLSSGYLVALSHIYFLPERPLCKNFCSTGCIKKTESMFCV